jgi:hypothetical protein
MIVLFGIVWSVRGNGGTPPNPALFLVELVALAVGIAGAWLARGLAVGRGLPTRTPVPAPSLAMRRTVPLSRIAR